MSDYLLKAEGLKKYFKTKSGSSIIKKELLRAVDGVDLHVRSGETLGLVGESGSGKSTLARLLLRLIEPTEGKIYFEEEDISTYKNKRMLKLRKDIQIVFQDPFACLNPRWKIGSIIAEPLKATRSQKNIKKQVQELMDIVGLNPEHYSRYPHEFSGGQRQRIGIARAIATKPKLIVCDEPVSALDVSIQAQIINLFRDLQKEFKLSYIFIAHDLSVVKHISERVAVMYLGKIVEVANSDTLFENPRHPYTKALLSAIPLPDPELEKKRQRIFLTGEIPSPTNLPSGCRFHTRCPIAEDICRKEEASLSAFSMESHQAACFFAMNKALGEKA